MASVLAELASLEYKSGEVMDMARVLMLKSQELHDDVVRLLLKERAPEDNPITIPQNLLERAEWP